MDNGNGSPQPAGFKAMSQNAESETGGNSDNQDAGRDLKKNLRSFGVDTDQLSEAAGEQVTALQQLLMDEVRARPMRALGWAAAIGVVVGFWAAK